MINPDYLTRDELAAQDPMWSAVAGVLDEWLHREHGAMSSSHGLGLFLELLEQAGWAVVRRGAGRFDMTCVNVHPVPGTCCPVCGGSGLLLEHKATYGGYRTIRHMDESGHEQVCTLPEEQGILYTSAKGWRYETKGGTS